MIKWHPRGAPSARLGQCALVPGGCGVAEGLTAAAPGIWLPEPALDSRARDTDRKRNCHV